MVLSDHHHRCQYRSSQRPSCHFRSAFTLIELLVVVAIIGLLILIILPAVQAARETSRRIACANNLHQLGISLQSYHDSFNVLPPGETWTFYSCFLSMLPFFENTQLYNSFNISIRSLFTISPGAINRTAGSQRISMLVCPSDFVTRENSLATTNYAGNGGYGKQVYHFNGIFTDRSDSSADTLVSLASVSDGTTNTIAFSEWIVGSDPHFDRNPDEAVFNTPSLQKPNQFELFVDTCRSLNPRTAETLGKKGAVWCVGEFGHVLFNCDLPPRSLTCLNGNSVNYGIYPANSRHATGVNTLFVDGHTSMINFNINLITWRSVSTRSSGEIFNLEDF